MKSLAIISGRFVLPLLTTVLLAANSSRGQDTNTIVSTNDLLQAEAMDNQDSDQVPDASATNDLNEAGQSADTNTAAGPAPDGRMRRLERQRRNRRPYSSAQGSSETTNSVSGPAALDYSAFRLITERNIFDPNRMPHAPGARPQPKVLDSFALVGTLSYGKGDFAFFDGTSPEFQKVLKPSDTIAGYKIISVTPEAVTLARETNEVKLAVGSQLRRQEDGRWVMVANAGSYAASTPASNGPAQASSVPSGPESEILKRLMQRREKE